LDDSNHLEICDKSRAGGGKLFRNGGDLLVYEGKCRGCEQTGLITSIDSACPNSQRFALSSRDFPAHFIILEFAAMDNDNWT
jgi:hypothetical protein